MLEYVIPTCLSCDSFYLEDFVPILFPRFVCGWDILSPNRLYVQDSFYILRQHFIYLFLTLFDESEYWIPYGNLTEILLSSCFATKYY